MTKPELALELRKRFPPPAHIRVSDEDLIEAAFEKATSGDHHIPHFLQDFNVNSGWFRTVLRRSVTEQQAKLLDNAVKIAGSLHELDNIRRASREDVPRDIYSKVRDRQKETEEHAKRTLLETDEQIRLERERARIEVKKQGELIAIDQGAAEWHERGDFGLSAAKALRAQKDALIDEIAALKKEPKAPETLQKIRHRRKALQQLEKQYDERFGS